MFTGIVEECGTVDSIRKAKRSVQLRVVGRVTGRGLKAGDSLAVNGCCLTLVSREVIRGGVRMRFDLLEETWQRTNLQFLQQGGRVNLERAMAAGGRFGGHFVTGHIDGMGTIRRWERVGRDHVLDIEAPVPIRELLVFKGSIAVDGISLTVAEVTSKGFRIWIIPHTHEVTNLAGRSVGDRVNLEADMLGKYVARFLELRQPSKSRRVLRSR